MAPTVLVVEDHTPARYVRSRILERAGFGIAEAATAEAALARARDASLVLLDVRLPDGDGFGVCEELKRSTPALPVVMITSIYRTAQARRDAFAVGADAFLLEPVEPRQLVRTIDTLLNQGRDALAREQNLTWIITDVAGAIQEISADAASLLNISARGARGRSLPAFFAGNRPGLLRDLLRAADGTIVEQVTTLQPRDRRPLRVRIDVSALPHIPGQPVRIQWTFAVEKS